MTARVLAPSLLAVLLLAPAAAPAERAAPSDPSAVRTARRVLRALGGREAWEATRFLAWDFFGKRLHVWDRHSGDLRTDAMLGYQVLMNLRTGEGRVLKDGVDLEGDELAEALRIAEATFFNDSYWLLMPYKLLDPGVRLRDLGADRLPDGRAAWKLGLTFGEVGVTPWNRYEVLVDQASGLVEEWRYFRSAADTEPRFALPFSGWRRHGSILLPHDHGRGSKWDAEVFLSLPRAVFEEPGEPLTMEELRRRGEVAPPLPAGR